MEEKAFFTAKEREQLFALYKRLLQLSGDTLQKGDCHKLKIHLIKAVAEGNLPRNCFGMNPIIKDMQTAVIVAEEIGMKRASILGIMLHESVKNHLCTLASVQQEYGEDVAGIIRGLVKINELYSKSPTIESENFRNLLLSFAEDMRVILIIIADRVNLMRQIKETPNIEARTQVANEAAYLYAPLAHKLGLYKLKSELEDLSLKYTEHDVYYHIKDKKGYKFRVEHVTKPASNYMPSFDIYEKYYGIGYLVKGDRQVSTPERTFFVHDGYLSPVSMGVYHKSSPLSDRNYEVYAVRFVSSVTTRIKEIIGENEFNDLMLHTALSVPDEIKPKIIDIYEQMLIEYDNYDSVAEFALQNLLEQLILIMYRYGTVAETSEIHISTADTEIMDILSYIDTNFMNNPSVSELAKKAGLSESHFMKRFRDATGCSYKTYVNRYKNKIAQTMLTESPKSIQEISNELGFCNSNYFCTLFKQINGMSPLQYRKNSLS